MKKSLVLLMAASALMNASFAYAEEEGFYFAVGGGLNHVSDDRVKSSGTVNNSIEYNNGYAAQGAIGYKYTNGLRSEVELSYRKNDVDDIAGARTSGHNDVTSAMVNVLYDFDITDSFDTYVGAGAGVAHVDYDRVRTAAGTQLDDSDTTPAVQLIAGASYPIADATEAFVDYKYFHATNPDFTNPAGANTKTDYDASTVVVGLKFNLYDNEPSHPPVVQPKPRLTPAPVQKAVQDPIIESRVEEPVNRPAAAPVSRTYIVFFDFDKFDVTNEALSILKQAAADAKAGNAVGIQVVGHADRSGTDGYNMALSKRRADSVEGALRSLGLTGANIQKLAKGESDPLVPTADGVREPQNRRVEVMYVVTPR